MIESRLSVDVFENEFEMGVESDENPRKRHTTHDTYNKIRSTQTMARDTQ
jgi:hypothetical protein